MFDLLQVINVVASLFTIVASGIAIVGAFRGKLSALDANSTQFQNPQMSQRPLIPTNTPEKIISSLKTKSVNPLFLIPIFSLLYGGCLFGVAVASVSIDANDPLGDFLDILAPVILSALVGVLAVRRSGKIQFAILTGAILGLLGGVVYAIASIIYFLPHPQYADTTGAYIESGIFLTFATAIISGGLGIIWLR